MATAIWPIHRAPHPVADDGGTCYTLFGNAQEHDSRGAWPKAINELSAGGL